VKTTDPLVPLSSAAEQMTCHWPPPPLPMLNRKHQLGALGRQCCQTTGASLLCGRDAGLCTNHLPRHV